MASKQRTLLPELNHAELLSDLEGHLRAPDMILWREPNLNGWAMGGDYGSPDLLAVPKSYSRFTRRVYEVKATTSDLTSDLRKEKWTRYLPLCDRVTFAVQDGVEWEKHLRPLPVGIMVLKAGKWRTVRAAPPNLKAEPWPETLWMALLFGKMGAKSDSRLARLEAAATTLREGEVRDLQFHVWERLRKTAADLHERERKLETREQEVERRAAMTERDHQQKAVRDLYRLMGQYASSYSEATVADLFKKWAVRTLETACKEARARLEQEIEATATQMDLSEFLP